MSNFSDKLRLKEMAEEDIYFAKRDQELINALHERNLAEHLNDDAKAKQKEAMQLEDKYAKETELYSSDTRNRPLLALNQSSRRLGWLSFSASMKACAR